MHMLTLHNTIHIIFQATMKTFENYQVGVAVLLTLFLPNTKGRLI